MDLLPSYDMKEYQPQSAISSNGKPTVDDIKSKVNTMPISIPINMNSGRGDMDICNEDKPDENEYQTNSKVRHSGFVGKNLSV